MTTPPALDRAARPAVPGGAADELPPSASRRGAGRPVPPGGRRPRRLGLALLVVLALLGATANAGTGGVAAAAVSADPVVAGRAGAGWVAAQVGADGAIPLPAPAVGPDVSGTLLGALALADAGVEGAAFARMVAWLEAHPDDAITGGVAVDNPGNLGVLLLVAQAAGVDPTSFGGVDLLTRLAATLGASTPGLYGAGDPTYDGTYRQGLALLGLRAHGVSLPAAAVAWLVDQQCGPGVTAAAGGWEAFRADPSSACTAPDPSTFTGADTNSTAMAVLALAGLPGVTGIPAALDFLAASQAESGGFGFLAGLDGDANSTGLVVAAIRAGGEEPGVGRWVRSGGTPISFLLSLQLGCDADPADRGAFEYQAGGGANLMATQQAIWGASDQALPITAPVAFTSQADPCAPATTTTSSTTSTTPASSTTSTSPPLAVAAAAVPASPAFAG